MTGPFASAHRTGLAGAANLWLGTALVAFCAVASWVRPLLDVVFWLTPVTFVLIVSIAALAKDEGSRPPRRVLVRAAPGLVALAMVAAATLVLLDQRVALTILAGAVVVYVSLVTPAVVGARHDDGEDTRQSARS